MRFALDQTQTELRDGAREFLRGLCTPERLRELRDSSNNNLKFWNDLAELGLLGFLVDESNGGLGMNVVGFSLVAEEAGYVALPEPLSDVAGMVLPTLNALGMSEECTAVVSGNARILSAHPINPYVNQLNEGDQLLVISQDKIRMLDARDYTCRSMDSIDPLRKIASVSFADDVGRVVADGEQAAALECLARLHGAVFSAAELLGLSVAMIDMATAYAQDRQQFGKPIGSYQAVKHHLANALVSVEFARPVMLRAAEAIATCHDSAEFFAAHAKLAATDAALQAAEVAIQVYGGMGYTYEVDLHLWMKRVWALQGLWGDRNHHANYIERRLLVDRNVAGLGQSFN